jgi:hypothetical protein
LPFLELVLGAEFTLAPQSVGVYEKYVAARTASQIEKTNQMSSFPPAECSISYNELNSRRDGRVAEGGGLLNRCRVVKLYRGFESPSLRQPTISEHLKTSPKEE